MSFKVPSNTVSNMEENECLLPYMVETLRIYNLYAPYFLRLLYQPLIIQNRIKITYVSEFNLIWSGFCFNI